jgi:hypothetical protein
MAELAGPAPSRTRKIVTGALWGTAGVIFAAILLGGYIALVFGVFWDFPSEDISVIQPADGAIVDTSTVVIRGKASPDSAEVYLALDDGRKEPLHVDADGNWFYRASLTPGPNTFTFYVHYFDLESDSLTVIYRPN